MIALIQRVNHASLRINGQQHCAIDKGLVLLLGIEKSDTRAQGEKLLQKVLDYRVFADADGRMNLSVRAIGGQVMLVSQFTLAADTGRGLRPSFTSAMPPADAEQLYDELVGWMQLQYPRVVTGSFGADMKVLLENDGPVTFSLQG
ncbi:MAG: D-tyrosyl-tRNA(Tyr) deacylase [Gammaproteobacteria bacterium]|nr:D-tyrosyl-tRNA(Tyr) deacylase [Gammaproteobacteria bacterium]